MSVFNGSMPMLQIVDLSAPNLAPEGWEEEERTPTGAIHRHLCV